MAWRRRYKVVEKGGGVGEVVQVAVRDVGVNAGENTPPLHITSLIEQHGKRNMAAKGGTVGGRDGLPCLSCAQYQDRIVQLEAQLQFTEKQMQVNNILNAMMNSLATQHNVSNASALSIAKGTRGTRTPSSRRRQRKKQQQEQQEKTPECEDEDEEQPTLLEMMQEELRRQDLLHALMNLLERPTTLEAARSGERLVPEYVKGLLMGIPEH
ncbi:hypothetical protein LSM04_008778 [Trypanosoma melophagium]|uniref:uncharacterized protein n=1 Tax=Trypanosoma melophagium TaxID=715481 RepID=UPI00351A72A8|nr:hypothetical protein LSM04_008778 [Trypanosoma melophagium]